MDGASFGSYFQASKESISGYIPKACDCNCFFAFGRKVAPLVVGCVIGLLLAPVSPLVAGAFVVAGALWTGYLLFKPLGSYVIQFFSESPEQSAYDLEMEAPDVSESYCYYPMDAIMVKLKNTTFEQVNNRDDLYRMGRSSACFTDHAHGVTTKISTDHDLCESAKEYVKNSDRVFKVCRTEEVGWAKSVGLMVEDPLLFVGEESVLNQWCDDPMTCLKDCPEAPVCFLKSDAQGKPYLMICESNRVRPNLIRGESNQVGQSRGFSIH